MRVCVRGLTGVAGFALEFWHFMRGHFYETLRVLLSAGLLSADPSSFAEAAATGSPVGAAPPWRRRLEGLAFGRPEYICPPHESFLSFYELLLPPGAQVGFDPGCAATSAQRNASAPGAALVLSFPTLPAREGDGGSFDWPAFLRTCRVAPRLGRGLALQRFGGAGDGAAGAAATLVLRRGPRDLLNPMEVAAVLERPPASRLVKFRQAALEDLTWHEQVRLMMTSDAVLCYHGAASGAHEAWLPEGSLLLSFDVARGWYCKSAYCAAADPKRDFLNVISTPKATGEAWSLSARSSRAHFRDFSTPAGARLARERSGEALPFYGPNHATFHGQHEVGRPVGLRAVHGLVAALEARASARPRPSLAAAYRSWAAGLPAGGAVLGACAGAAVQVFE